MKLRDIDDIIRRKKLQIIAAAFAVFTVPAFNACTEDVVSESKTDDGEKATVTLSVVEPNLINGTRAKVDADEATFSNIYLVTVKTTQVDENNIESNLATPEITVHSLTNKHTSEGTTYPEGTHYKNYAVSLVPGKYRFYVYVNFDNYLSQRPDNSWADIIKSESDLGNLTLDYSKNRIQLGELPMSCMPKQMKRNGSLLSEGIVNIVKGDNNMITAPVTILCSKVRYTILFDAREGAFSSAFENERIRFIVSDNDKPYAGKLSIWNDVPDKIKSNNFNDGYSYWGNNYGNNPGLDYGVAEFFYSTFDFNQTLGSLDKGLYRLDAQAFYRYGSIQNAWESHRNGTEELLAELYIKDKAGNESKTPIRSLYSEYNFTPAYDRYWTWDDTDNDYANSLKGANIVFNYDDKYHNSVYFKHTTNADVIIGISKTEKPVTDDWVAFDNFRLYKASTDEDGDQGWAIPLDRYIFDWDATMSPTYPTSESDNRLKAWDGTSLQEWNALDHKAWQGVVYLPENLASEQENKTVLHFPYTYRELTQRKGEKEIILFDESRTSNPTGDNGELIRHGLQRGMMYDIVAKVKTPDELDNILEVLVKVNPWNYVPETVEW